MLVENFFFKPEILAGMKDNDQIHHDTNTNTSNRLEALLEAAGLFHKKNLSPKTVIDIFRWFVFSS